MANNIAAAVHQLLRRRDLDSGMDTDSVASSSASTTASDDLDQPGEEHIALDPEDDPGPGVLKVRISGSVTVHQFDKRLLAFKSIYFRSFMARFQRREAEKQHRDDNDVHELVGLVTDDALVAVKQFLTTNKLSIKCYEDAMEYLNAANYLQIESLQNYLAKGKIIKQFVKKNNHVTMFNDFASARGIKHLGDYIRSSLIKPAEMARKRKYGKFDLTFELGQFQYLCHKTIISSVSRKIRCFITSHQDASVISLQDLGIKSCPQSIFDLLELIYLDRDSISFNSVEDALAVLKNFRELEFSSNYFDTCYNYLKKQISADNAAVLYQTGFQLLDETLVDMALFYLMYDTTLLEKMINKLSRQDLCKILRHSYLNITSEFQVLKMVIGWLNQSPGSINQSREILTNIRWGLISSVEVEYLLQQESVDDEVKKIVLELSKVISEKEPRGWPQLLLLIETRDFSSSTPTADYNIHCYNSTNKKWNALFSKSCEKLSSFQSVTKVSKNSLVFCSDPRKSKKLYNLWQDSWSNSGGMESPRDTEEEQHNLGSVAEDSLFTVQRRCFYKEKKDMIVIRSTSHLSHETPVHSKVKYECDLHLIPSTAINDMQRSFTSKYYETVPDIFTNNSTIHVIHCHQMNSYDTENNAWMSRSISSSVVGGAWLSLEDGGVVCVGGYDVKSREVTRDCLIFRNLDSEPRKIGPLWQGRVGASVVEYRGFIFVAGGHKQSNKRKRSSSDEVTDDQSKIESSVEFYVPDLDCWSVMPGQPRVQPGARLTLLSMSQPMRMMEVSFPPARGVKRLQESVENLQLWDCPQLPPVHQRPF